MAKKNKKAQESRVSNIPQKEANKSSKGILIYKEGMSVKEVADGLSQSVGNVIKKLMMLGVMANQNQTIDRETVELIAADFGATIKDEVVTDATRFDEFTIEDDAALLESRPPVVTIMGHVDMVKQHYLTILEMLV